MICSCVKYDNIGLVLLIYLGWNFVWCMLLYCGDLIDCCGMWSVVAYL